MVSLLHLTAAPRVRIPLGFNWNFSTALWILAKRKEEVNSNSVSHSVLEEIQDSFHFLWIRFDRSGGTLRFQAENKHKKKTKSGVLISHERMMTKIKGFVEAFKAALHLLKIVDDKATLSEMIHAIGCGFDMVVYTLAILVSSVHARKRRLAGSGSRPEEEGQRVGVCFDAYGYMHSRPYSVKHFRAIILRCYPSGFYVERSHTMNPKHEFVAFSAVRCLGIHMDPSAAIVVLDPVHMWIKDSP
ncbi:hypothetical protein VNO77_22905 [Canavalia gladiata]|uniref:Uncharacterized protein n=1 Tax=Canavalia gladiata TaxID=3824 RepID=A0AAN9L6S7_CANGL